MSKLTVIILAKNEEQNIVDCINSAKFADEVLIIDDFSTDKTVTLTEEDNYTLSVHGLAVLTRTLLSSSIFSNPVVRNHSRADASPSLI